MLGPAVAHGIVDRNRKICARRSQQPLFDRFPRGQAVGKADDGKIVRQGRTQHRAAAACGREPGNYFDFRLGTFPAQLIDERRHAVNAAVARADDAHLPALPRQIQRQLAALCLLRHGRFKKCLSGIAVLDEVDIDRVPNDCVAGGERTVCADGHIFKITGADAHNKNLTQSVPPNAPARRRQSRRPSQFLKRAAAPRRAWPPARRRCPHL